MGTCDSNNIQKKRVKLDTSQLLINEIEELYLYESAICKIRYEIIENNRKKEQLVQVFFVK